jgi:hypothetical protein
VQEGVEKNDVSGCKGEGNVSCPGLYTARTPLCRSPTRSMARNQEPWTLPFSAWTGRNRTLTGLDQRIVDGIGCSGRELQSRSCLAGGEDKLTMEANVT